ncbi:MAG: hypothetical protein J2P53_13925, partial [Bradyrhizobiaceae bacterium]|nr:hypothetical protein [Bradyrhizobiaceae bacterium]
FSRLPANSGSDAIADEPMGLTARYIPRLRPGVEDLPRHREGLCGSQSQRPPPFRQAGIPAIMWTDTADFRNPNYHLTSDMPDTLDYDFMGDVTRLALAHAVSMRLRQAGSGSA